MKKVSLAKITRPGIRRAVPRPRLFSRLDDGLASRLLWLCGPPGAGKTTLAASYLEARPGRCLWYQLDRGDADIATFFYYLREAVGEPGEAGAAPLPLLTPEYLDDIPTFTRRFFRELFALDAEPLLLVFDNFHEVPLQSPLAGVFRDGLGEVPEHGAVLVLSRDDPPPALARLRASGTLVTLGWPDLQLTREESDAIALQRDRRLCAEALDGLYQRSSGWAAGLVLLLEQGAGSTKALEAAERLLPQVLFDYLTGELFEQMSAETQQFLLSTACLKRISLEMAAALDAAGHGPAILQKLAQAGSFVTERSLPEGLVFEFHPMLREFLLRRAREQASPAQFRQWQERAAEQLLEAGQVEDAIELLLELGQWDRAAAEVARHAGALVQQGRGETMAGWFDDFPPEVFEANPWLLYWHGVCRSHVTPRESRRLFERGHALFTGGPAAAREGALLCSCGVIDAVLQEMDDLSLLDPWIAELSSCLEAEGEPLAPALEARIAGSLFSATMVRWPDTEALRQWLERAYTLSLASGDSALRLAIEPQVAISVMWTGHFERARAVLDGLHALAESGRIPPLGTVALDHAEAMYRMLVNDRDGALAAVAHGLETAAASGIQLHKHQLRAIAAAAHLGNGELDAAASELELLNRELRQLRRFDLCVYHYVAGWYAQLRHDAVAAYQEFKQSLRLASEVGIPFYEVICRLGLARLAAAQDERVCASHLTKVHALTRNINSHLLAFMALLPYVEIALEHGRRQSALNSLRYAFGLGREHGYYHLLGWDPELMARLCVVALEEGIEPGYAQALVRRRGLFPESPPYHLEAWPWPFRVRTLGGFEVSREGQALAGEGKAQRRPLDLLKLLVALGGSDVRSEQAAEALWPHVDGDYAYRSLTTTLHRLRKLLGDDDAVLLRDGRLSLNPRLCWVDARAFAELSGELEARLRAPGEALDADAVEPLAQQLLDLYRGNFLADEDELPQYLAYREHLRARFTRCVSRLAARHEARGSAEQAHDCLERGIESDPANEALYRMLIESQLRAGMTLEAGATYERCRAALWSLRQATPTAETRALAGGD